MHDKPACGRPLSRAHCCVLWRSSPHQPAARPARGHAGASLPHGGRLEGAVGHAGAFLLEGGSRERCVQSCRPKDGVGATHNLFLERTLRKDECESCTPAFLLSVLSVLCG